MNTSKLTDIHNRLLLKRVMYAARLVFCMSSLGYVFIKYDPASIFLRLNNILLFKLFIGWLFLYGGVLISSAKWGTILRCYDKNYSAFHLFRLYLEAGFLNLFFPGFVAGDLSRIARSSSNGKGSIEAAFSVFLERFSGLVFVCLYVGCIALFGGYRSLGPVWHNVIFLTAIMVLLLILLLANIHLANALTRFMPSIMADPLAKTARKIQNAITVLKSRPLKLLQIFTLSALFFLMLTCAAYFISRSVNFQIPFKILMLYVPLTALISSLPISIAGIGVRENINVVFYSTLGFIPHEIIAFGLATSALGLLINFSGGILILFNSLLGLATIEKGKI